ncbi:MAG TPA: maleylpyruvate isomerase family mycothiol-dependent enzyme [Acidimicrobiia bacterium]
MALPRSTVTTGFLAELDHFSSLLRTLTDEEWSTPSRCEGWTVGDVASHFTGSMTSVVTGNLDGIGTPEVTRREVEERRGRTPGEIADELDAAAKATADMLALFDDAAWDGPAPAGLPYSLGVGVEALWYDAYLHADDIRAATGRPSERGPGLEAAVSHVAYFLADKGWGPATLALDGTAEYEVGGGGRRVTGDALVFVLAATGRADPAPLGLDATVNIYG